MNTNRLIKQILTAAIASSTLLAAGAGAAPLPCVQRAIDWNNSNPLHRVDVTMVALHEIGVAAFATNVLTNSVCVQPLSLTGCLATDAPTGGLLSNRFKVTTTPIDGGFGSSTYQPFDIEQPLPLEIEPLRANSSYLSHIRSGATSYDFTASCVGNLVVGNDQFGNHWTLALQLQTNDPPPR